MPQPLRISFLGCGFIIAAIREGRAPEMRLARAREDHRLMDEVRSTVHA